MANIQGASKAVPQVIASTETQTRGASVPGGTRTGAIMGEGSRMERLVVSAVGNGNDGFNSTYSSTNGSDGRHFKTSLFPIISNRITLFRNGIPIQGFEQSFDSNSGNFNNRYKYRINIENGRIELQTASLVDQGGKFYKANLLNEGTGSINDLSLIDVNAPTETWDIRCVSVRRDSNGDPIDGYAKFITKGSISGIILDGYGNQISWQSNNEILNNGILQFSISEGTTSFKEGDRFSVKVEGGALNKGETLSISYIAQSDLEDPEFFTDLQQLTVKHGQPSLTNRLSLGAQLAFANNPPGIWTLQTKPAIPRRMSYTLEESASGNATADDLQFALPLNVIPDSDSNVRFFVTDAATGIESQIIPNKISFYDSNFTLSPNAFHFGTNAFAYTVILEDAVIKNADGNGTIVSSGLSATIESLTVVFDSSDVAKTIKILEPDPNAGLYVISAVEDGIATIEGGTFVDSEDVNFQVIDDTLQSAKILFSEDLALGTGDSLRVTLVDVKDADYFDAGWENAFAALETINTNMVVPLPTQTISAIQQAALSHVLTMSQPQYAKERMLLTGAIRGLTPDNIIGNKDAAVEDIGILEGIQGDSITEILSGDTEDLTDYSIPSNFGRSFRCMYFYPDEIVVQIAGDRVLVDGMYMAAAALGWFSGVSNIAMPLTRKNLTGFTILRNKVYRPIIVEQLAEAGACVVTPIAGGGNVVWGKTTTQSGFAEEEEASIVFIRDRVAEMARKAFDVFVGLPEDPTTIGSMLNKMNTVLQGAKSQKLITAVGEIKIKKDDVEPRQYNITVSYIAPSYPTNWLNLRFSFGV